MLEKPHKPQPDGSARPDERLYAARAGRLQAPRTADRMRACRPSGFGHAVLRCVRQLRVDCWPTLTTANGYLRFVAQPHQVCRSATDRSQPKTAHSTATSFGFLRQKAPQMRRFLFLNAEFPDGLTYIRRILFVECAFSIKQAYQLLITSQRQQEAP